MTLIDKAEAHDDDLIRRGDICPAVNKALAESRDIRDAIAAIPARGVGVKPLVWVKEADDRHYAQTPFGAYEVWDDFWRATWQRRIHSADPFAAAQADYEARIRSALHVNETPEIEHDASNVLTEAPDAREAALRDALSAIDALPEYGSPDVNIGVGNAYSAVYALLSEPRT